MGEGEEKEEKEEERQGRMQEDIHCFRIWMKNEMCSCASKST